MPSSRFRREMFSSETKEVLLTKMIIEPTDGSDTIYAVNNSEDMTIDGIVYHKAGFEAEWPDQSEDTPFHAIIKLNSVSGEFIQLVRDILGRPSITLSRFLASSPEYDEDGPYTFKLAQADWGNGVMTATVTNDDHESEPYPGDNFTPSQWTGMF